MHKYFLHQYAISIYNRQIDVSRTYIFANCSTPLIKEFNFELSRKRRQVFYKKSRHMFRIMRVDTYKAATQPLRSISS